MFAPLRLLPLYDLLGNLPQLHAILGMRHDGRPALLDISDAATPHIMIDGPAGTGKSELLRTIVMSLCLRNQPHQLGLMVLDSGRPEQAVLEALPHFLPGATIESIDAELKRLSEQQRLPTEIILTVDGLESQDRLVRWIAEAPASIHLVTTEAVVQLPGARLTGYARGMFEMQSGPCFQAAYLPAIDLNLVIRLLRAQQRSLHFWKLGWRAISTGQSLPVGERL